MLEVFEEAMEVEVGSEGFSFVGTECRWRAWGSQGR